MKYLAHNIVIFPNKLFYNLNLNQQIRQSNLIQEIELNNLKKAKGLYIYDIESDPDIKHDFLHGFIRLPKNIKNEISLEKTKYSPLLNLEKKMKVFLWKRITKKLSH